jgi:hypothetical protein
MCSPAHFHSTIVTRVCNQQIMVIYNLYYYHAASYLKKGSLFRVCTHFGFIFNYFGYYTCSLNFPIAV